MPITPPPIDNRDYADILKDALARIPVHNPEWTNFNDSDPGVTLIQLFAFMTESILYRANQIPERNHLKFLQLLGVQLASAASARGFVTLQNERGPLASRVQAGGLDVRAGQVRFRTAEAGLEILPATAQLFYKQPVEQDDEQQALYSQLYADLLGENQVPAFYETASMPQPQADGTLPVLDLANTVDGCLWIALLARPRENPTATRSHLLGKTLTLGVMPRLDDPETNSGIRIAAGQTNRADTDTPIRWEIADATNPNQAAYRPLTARTTAAILTEPGLVELDLPATDAQLTSWNFATLEPGIEGTGDYPPSLADTNLSDHLITWIRLRVPKDSATARLSWLDINATEVQQTVKVTGEVVGTGSGEPDQTFRLANASILPASLVLTVGDNPEHPEPWKQIDDLLAADPEVPISSPRLPIYQTESPVIGTAVSQQKVFFLDPESGEITFGDGAHGTRPIGRIVASYVFGGGAVGNVGIGSIDRAPALPPGYKVTNPIRTWGGDDAQDTETAKKGVARYVQHRDRLVSIQDFEDITRQTPGIDLGRVAVLPLFDPNNKTVANVPGVITVMVIPQQSSQSLAFGLSTTLNNPQPDSFFLQAVCNHLQPRRLVTTELHVRGPEYKDMWVSVGIELLGGYAAGPVREAVKRSLTEFLSPLRGGQQQIGWPLNVPVLQAELEAVVSRVAGVRLVNDPLRLGSATADNLANISMSGLDLPRLAGVSVVSGAAIPLSELRSPTADAALPDGATEWTPIPVLPERC